MIFAGIDIGSLTAEAVLLADGRPVGSEIMPVLPDPVGSARAVLERALGKCAIRREDIAYTVSTGYGREAIEKQGLANRNMSEISCHGFGAFSLDRSVRTVIDIGGQDAKVIKIDGRGKLQNFVMNDKCAAGTGHFLEVMSRALGVGLGELGEMSSRARKPVTMSSRCTIYVETEVIHFLQRGIDRTDIAAGINQAMAARVLALVRRVRPEREIMLSGGVAKNPAIRQQLEKELGCRLIYPGIDPQLVGAYGAAVYAMQTGGPS
jgi:predicted CoA-substrate-specific enzyme activase